MAGKYTEAQKKATYKYFEDKCKIQILVTKEQREKYKEKAKEKGLSLSQYIIQALEES